MPIPDTASPPDAPPAATSDAATDDSVYDAAIAELLAADDSPEPPASQPSSDDQPPAAEEPRRTDDALSWATLDDQERQTLSRSRIDQSMFESWTADQRRTFLEHQSKRERDQADSYRTVSEQNARLQRELEEREAAIARGEAPEEQPSEGVADAVGEVIDELADTYGEEMRPLKRAFQAMQERLQSLERHGQAAPVMSRMIAELTMSNAIQGLASEYPSLSKPDVRRSIEQKFAERWPTSEHKNQTEVPMLERIGGLLREIARDEFGNVTEAAAAASLIGRSQDRIARQPVVGHGKGRTAPLSEDDVMDQAFEETIAPVLRNRY